MDYDELNQYKIIIDKEINNIYHNGPKLLKDPINYIVKGGKRLRPILCMLSYESYNKEINNEVISISVAVELLHIFSLIHDDIMDDDRLRHGKKTVHCKWNIPIAILVGDAVLALAMRKLDKTSNSIKEKFNEALLKVCEGQALDIEYESIDSLNLSEYFKMINLKTGHMLGLSAQLGSLCATSDLNYSENFMDFGLLLGETFQLQDDLLEIVSTKEKMGKSLMSDVVLNKKTYIYLIAQKYYPDELNDLFNQYQFDHLKLNEKFKEFLYDNRIIEKCQEKIDMIFKKIDNMLINLDIDKAKLNIFINNIRNRSF